MFTALLILAAGFYIMDKLLTEEQWKKIINFVEGR